MPGFYVNLRFYTRAAREIPYQGEKTTGKPFPFSYSEDKNRVRGSKDELKHSRVLGDIFALRENWGGVLLSKESAFLLLKFCLVMKAALLTLWAMLREKALIHQVSFSMSPFSSSSE